MSTIRTRHVAAKSRTSRAATNTGTDPPSLRIHLLGGFRITVGEQSIPEQSWRLRKARSLVKLLALAPSHRMHREQVMDQLWPDLELEQAANNLHSTLSVARAALAMGRPPAAHSMEHTDAGPTAAFTWDGSLCLRLRQHVLALDPPGPLWIDVEEFEAAVDAARHTDDPAACERALTLYAGDLLPDDRYEDWASGRREALRIVYVGMLLKLAKLHEGGGALEAAIEALRRVVASEPTHETAHAGLMRLYALTGQRHQALRQYTQLRQTLLSELDAQPEPASQQLYEDIRVGRLVPVTPAFVARSTPPLGPALPQSASHPLPEPAQGGGSISPPATARSLAARAKATPPLVGRQREWQRVVDAARAHAGHPHLVLIAGEAGIGKTRLAEEALVWASSQRRVTATARCYAAEGELAYGPVIAWLRTEALWAGLLALNEVWLTEIARLLPELLVERPSLPHGGPVTASWQRQRLFEGLARALLANGQPLTLLLDDLQWCDHDTLEWLRYLLRFDEHTRVLVVATLRPEEVERAHPAQTLLAALRRGEQVTVVELGPLDAAETAALGAQVAGGGRELDADQAARLFVETEGNPLFVVQSVRAGLMDRWISQPQSTGGATDLSPSLLPTVHAVIASRLERLSPAARDLVDLAAVIGRSFDFDLLAQTSPRSEAALVRALDSLLQRRIVREHGADNYDFSHDKLREVAYAGLSTARRRTLHRRLARALEAVHAGKLDAASGKIALHYAQSDTPDQATPYLERAGDYARSLYANAEAESYYRDLVRRLESARQLAPVARAREKLGAVLSDQARFDEAKQMLERAGADYRASGDQEGVLSAMARLGQVDGATGAAATGIVRLQLVLRELTPREPSAGLAALYATLANLHYLCDQYNEQLEAAERAAEVALAIGDRRVLAAAERERGIALLNLGRVADAQTVLEQVVILSEALNDLWTLCFTLRGLSVVYVARGEVAQGYRTAQRAQDYGQLVGAPTVRSLMAQRLSTVAYFMGRWEEARAEAERAAVYLERIGPSLARLYPLLILGRLALAQGQFDVAEAQLGEAIALAERSGNLYGLRAAHGALAERDLLEGDPETARARLEPLLDRPGQQEGDVIALLILLAWAHVELGDTARANAFLAQSEARSAPEGMRATLVDSMRVRALLALRQRRWQAARAALAESLALAQAMGYPYAEARARYVTGLLRLEQGKRAQARTELQEALTILTRLGERLYAAHVERTLADLAER